VAQPDLEEHSEALYLLAAALFGDRRRVHAAELLECLDAIAARRPNWRQWRARSEFLWAVHAEQTADTAGVLEHTAAAAESVIPGWLPIRLLSEAEQNASQPRIPRPALLEPLSERERQVLQYLPSHRTTRQIAELMFVSTSTVKTHQKSIYRKIGATCRDEAVTIAGGHALI
jgi:DNA-binding CsgD family transcriptional regulator